MVMSTQILAEAAARLQTVLIDRIQIMEVGEPVTVGTTVTRSLTPVGQPIDGLVQTTSLENAVESQVSSVFSIKVARGTALKAGQAVKILFCRMEPDLAGKILLVDKISKNGASIIRKAVASSTEYVNQEGKESLT